MTMKRKCKKCGHTQTLKDGRKTKTSWRCSDCGYQNKLRNAIIALVALLTITSMVGIAYADGADHIDLPVDEPFDDQYCTFLATDNHVIFTCSWKWFLPEYIMVELDPDNIPERLSDIPQHNFDLSEQIKLLIEEGEPEPIEDPTDLDFQEFLHPEVPLTFEERKIQDSIKKLDECLRGLGAWAAYQDQTSIEYFVDESRWSFPARDNLSGNIQILRILKAIEECDIMRTYEKMNLIGAYELNKVLADIADVDYLGRGPAHPLEQKVTDQSDAMVATDPVTPKDIADEIEDMERILDDLIEQRVFKDPYAELPDVNLQPEGLRCQILGQPSPIGVWATEKCPLSLYEEHILQNWDAITYTDIRQLQCDNFLYIYQHKIGTDDFPQWLNHCVPKVVREG